MDRDRSSLGGREWVDGGWGHMNRCYAMQETLKRTAMIIRCVRFEGTEGLGIVQSLL